MEIKREKVDTRQLKDKFYNALDFYERRINDLQKNPYLARNLSTRSFDLFFGSFLFDNDREKTKFYLRLFAESTLAKFLMAFNVGKSVTLTINNTTIELTPDERDYEISPLQWTNLFYASCLLKDENLLTGATAMDLAKVNELSGAKTEPYNFYFALFLQKWYRKQGDVSNDLVTASKASNEVSKQSPLYDYMLDVAGPQIDLFGKILYREEAEFNKLLEEAVQYHKNFFEGESKNGIVNTAGIISLPLSAISLIGKNTGFSIELSSDFLWIPS